jgi:hypothetical protein
MEKIFIKSLNTDFDGMICVYLRTSVDRFLMRR